MVLPELALMPGQKKLRTAEGHCKATARLGTCKGPGQKPDTQNWTRLKIMLA